MKKPSNAVPDAEAIYLLQCIVVDCFRNEKIFTTAAKKEEITHFHLYFCRKKPNVALARMLIFSIIRQKLGTPYIILAKMYGTDAAKVYRYCKLISDYEKDSLCASTIALRNKILRAWERI